MQSKSDGDYFLMTAGRAFTSEEADAIRTTFLRAYRWQYIVSGVQEPRFNEVLGSMINAAQGERINAALAPLFA
jgi:hypothetical protein